jgi:hypothetical protein
VSKTSSTAAPSAAAPASTLAAVDAAQPAPAPTATPDAVAAVAPPETLSPVAPQEDLVTIVRSATPSPRAASPAAATTAPAGPSGAPRTEGVDPAAARAQIAARVSSLVSAATNALAARDYDAALRQYEDALRLDPQNAPALAGRASATVARTHARRTFVAGRTAVQTEKAGRGGLAGFDSSNVSLQKAPDFQGRIDFVMTPASVQPGDAWSLKVYVVNEGKKAIKISALSVSTVINGARSGGGGAARTRDIAPQQRGLVEELSGTWPSGVTSWSTEVKVVAGKGDTLQNELTWR